MNWQFSPNIGRIVASCNSIEIAWVTIDARGKRGNRDMNKLLLSVAITQAIYIYIRICSHGSINKLSASDQTGSKINT